MLQLLGGLNRVLVTVNHGIGMGPPGGPYARPPGGRPEGPDIWSETFSEIDPTKNVAFVGVDSTSAREWKNEISSTWSECAVRFRSDSGKSVLTTSDVSIQAGDKRVPFGVDSIDYIKVVTAVSVRTSVLSTRNQVGLLIGLKDSESYILFNLVDSGNSRSMVEVLFALPWFIREPLARRIPLSIVIEENCNVRVCLENECILVFQPIPDCVVYEPKSMPK